MALLPLFMPGCASVPCPCLCVLESIRETSDLGFRERVTKTREVGEKREWVGFIQVTFL